MRIRPPQKVDHVRISIKGAFLANSKFKKFTGLFYVTPQLAGEIIRLIAENPDHRLLELKK